MKNKVGGVIVKMQKMQKSVGGVPVGVGSGRGLGQGGCVQRIEVIVKMQRGGGGGGPVGAGRGSGRGFSQGVFEVIVKMD